MVNPCLHRGAYGEPMFTQGGLWRTHVYTGGPMANPCLHRGAYGEPMFTQGGLW